jgi:predicted benzoate:H+ symporter BenE
MGRHAGGVDVLYLGADGAPPRIGWWSTPGLLAWAAGAVTFYFAQPIGGVLPSLVVSIVVYLVSTSRTPDPN